MAPKPVDRGSIPLRAREVMILRTCARCGAEYEWGVHVANFGAKAALNEAQLRSTVHGSAADDCWTAEEERMLLRLADQLHERQNVDDALWRDAAERFSPAQLVELVMLAGLYHAVSFAVNAFRVAPEAFAPGFPP